MISLTEKDADYIANYCREQIESIEKGYISICKEKEEILSLSKNIKGMSEEDYKDLVLTKENTINKVTAVYEKEKAKLEKIIELMMLGSEK